MDFNNVNRLWQWRDEPSVPVADLLHSWLTNRGSLTNRLCTICEDFQVVLHQSRVGRVCPDEVFLLLVGNGGRGMTTLVREVSLVCDGVPLVFGHSILLTRQSGPLARSFSEAGSNSLGPILFSHPDIQRGPLCFKRINRQHALYAKSAAAFGDAPDSFFWARRSVFSLRLERVCVTEVFSPQLVATLCNGSTEEHHPAQRENKRIQALYRPANAHYNAPSFVGGIAQLGERLHGMQEVSGSIPLTSTRKKMLLYPRPHRLEA